MIFHYNPLETFLEVNADGELLCTINTKSCLQPKLRYNVGDEARLHTLAEVRRALGDDAYARMWTDERMSLPLLFLFGRKDSTISYMGANLYPQDVEYGLYQGNPHAAAINRFCLSLEELPGLEYRPVINLEVRGEVDRDDLVAICRKGVVAHLSAVSRDFAESLKEDPSAADLRIRVFGLGEGPFAGLTKMKNVYLVKDA